MCNTSTHERYVNFYTDFAFKKLFGTEMNKELLLSFLQSLFEGREVIKDLTYLNTEHLGSLATDRKAVFDVYCENENGEKFLIEMQKASQDYFKDRSIFYSTFPIQEQAPVGQWNFQLSRVYTIGILNFCFDDADEYMHHEVKLIDTKTHEVFYDKLTYVYLEMPKFHKQEQELETLFDKWLYAIKNLSVLLERPLALQEAVFQRLFSQAEISSFTPTELQDYRQSQKEFWDFNACMETAENKGRKEGLEEGEAIGLEKGEAIGLEKGEAIGLEKGEAIGLEKGASQKAVSIARSMLSDGLPITVISKYTGLTEEEIQELKTKFNS